MVIADNTVYLGARQIQLLSQLPNRVLRYPAETLEEHVQDLHEHLGARIEFRNDLCRYLFVVAFSFHA